MVGFNSIAKYKTVAKSCQAQYLQTGSLYTKGKDLSVWNNLRNFSFLEIFFKWCHEAQDILLSRLD